MSDNPTSKSNEVRIDREKNLVFVPGSDTGKELLAPIVQRFDADGNPYQHVATASEMIAAEEQHQRCMKFWRNAMQQSWRCDQCTRIWPGTQLRSSPQLLDLLREMIQPGSHRVDWDSIVEHLHEHLKCPDVACDAPVRPAPKVTP